MNFNQNQGQQQGGFNQGTAQDKDTYIRTKNRTSKGGETFPSLSVLYNDLGFQGQPAMAINLSFTKAFSDVMSQYGIDLKALLLQLDDTVILSGNRRGWTPKERSQGQGNYQNQNQGGFNGGQQQTQQAPAQQQYPNQNQGGQGFNGQAGNLGGAYPQNTPAPQQPAPQVQPNLNGIPF